MQGSARQTLPPVTAGLLRRAAASFSLIVACGLASQMAGAATPEDSTSAYSRASPVQRLAERSTVVGSRGHARAVPGSAHFVGPDILPHQNQSFDDIHRLMLRIPGVYALGEDGYGLRPHLGMRGLDPYRSAGLAIMEDGVLASPAPYAAPGMPVFAGLARMESIETIKGPGAIPYGPGTTGGTVNMLSRAAPDDLLGEVRFSLGSDNAHTLHADYGDSWKAASWILGTHRTRTDGFKVLDSGGETGFEHDDYLVKFNLRSALNATRYQDMLFKFGYFKTDAHDSYLGLTDADFRATPYRRYAASQRDRMQHDATQILLRHFIAIDDAIDVTTSFYRNDVDLGWYVLDGVGGETLSDVLANPAFFSNEFGVLRGDSASADDALTVKANAHAYSSAGVQSVLGATFGTGRARHDLEGGLRYHKDEEDRLDRNDGYRMVSGGTMELTTRGADGGAGGADNRINEAHALSGFLRDRISGGKWSVTPGLRVEYVRTTQSSYGAGDGARGTAPTQVENSTTAVLPGMGVTYRAARGVTLLGGIHTGHAPPPAGVGGHGYKAVHYEAGGRARHNNLNAALIGFLSNHGWVGERGTIVRAGGFEASADYEIQDPEYGIALSAAYTFTQAEYRWSTTVPDVSGILLATEAGNQIPNVPEHSLTASVVATTQKSYLGVFANYMSRTRTVSGSGTFPDSQGIDARVLVDLVTEYELIERVRVFASVSNILDEVYVASRFPYGAHPGAPQTFAAGLKLAL